MHTYRLLTDMGLSNDQEDEDGQDEKALIGFWSAFSWLVGMTVIIALLSEYVVGTIEVHGSLNLTPNFYFFKP